MCSEDMSAQPCSCAGAHSSPFSPKKGESALRSAWEPPGCVKCRRLACVNVEMCCEKALLANHENGCQKQNLRRPPATRAPRPLLPVHVPFITSLGELNLSFDFQVPQSADSQGQRHQRSSIAESQESTVFFMLGPQCAPSCYWLMLSCSHVVTCSTSGPASAAA